jgi:hypothetical protein
MNYLPVTPLDQPISEGQATPQVLTLEALNIRLKKFLVINK